MTNKIQLPAGYKIDHNTLFHMEHKREQDVWRAIAPAMYFNKKVRNLDTKKYAYNLVYLTGGQYKQLIVSGETLTLARIEDLIQFGVDIVPGNKAKVLAYFIQQRNLVDEEVSFDSLGWLQFDGCTYFGLDQLLPAKTGLTSINTSKAVVKPAGSEAAWLELFHTSIEGNTPLELAVVLGLSAAVVAAIHKINADISNLFVNIVGQSSGGKTTIAKLAASVAGKPGNQGGLIHNWSATANALLLKLDGNHGVPLVLDELSIYRGRDITGLVYQLADGEGKSRATQDAKLKDVKAWSTTLISTGELSVFQKVNNNDGLRVRIIELENIEWTQSAKESDHIKTVVEQNYGWVLPEFVQKFMNAGYTSTDKLGERYFKQRQQVVEQLPESRFRDRLGSRIAVLTTTAYLANELLNWQLDVDALTKLLVAQTSDKLIDDIGIKAKNKLVQYLVKVQNNIHFIGLHQPNSRVIGQCKEQNGHLRFDILRDELHRILQDELNFQSIGVIINEWQKIGLLSNEPDRQTRRVKMVEHDRATVYTLLLPLDYKSQFMVFNQLATFDEMEEMDNITKPKSKFLSNVNTTTEADIEAEINALDSTE